MSFNSVNEELTDQKKLATLRELERLLIGRVITKIELDPTPGKLAPLIKLTFGDGTTFDSSMAGNMGLDGGWYDFFLVNVNGSELLRL